MNKAEARSFLKELDADRYAESFIQSVEVELLASNQLANMDIEHHFLDASNRVAGGRVITLWSEEKIIAIANILRINVNWILVVCQRSI